MKTFNANIPIGLGDLLYIKGIFETIKHEYSCINLSFHRELITKYNRDSSYNFFLDEVGKLLFSESPYNIDNNKSFPFCSLQEMVTAHNLHPQKPNLSHILCEGTSLDLDSPYVVINTKIRSMPRSLLESKIREFWKCLNILSHKYKIVILGERVVEMNQEYQIYTTEHIYSLYPHILNNIPASHLVDLTIPSLGITTPDISQIKQDCLIMNQAEFVINFGIGGGFCMATSVANTIGYRYDDDYIADIVFSKNYPKTTITKDWDIFIKALKETYDSSI